MINDTKKGEKYPKWSDDTFKMPAVGQPDKTQSELLSELIDSMNQTNQAICNRLKEINDENNRLTTENNKLTEDIKTISLKILNVVK
tara:strand:- start:38242 stop:38502 length:261 start_codon:yes stop_codon:yes gene_type:complete